MLASIEKQGNISFVKLTVNTLDAGNEKRFRVEIISHLDPNANVVLAGAIAYGTAAFLARPIRFNPERE